MGIRKSKYWKAIVVTIGTSIGLLICAEAFLRYKYGLNKTILFRYDKDFEYIQIPQSVNRMGNNNYYNEYSQRNRELSKQDSVYVDFIGDSVLNGGVLVDQDSLATTKLSQYWTTYYHKPVLALNIAAGSWGPDNGFAYIKKYGDFKAKYIVMVVSSHDSYDDMTHENIVGKNPSYPNKQPLSAVTEAVFRYVPKYFSFLKNKDAANELMINKKTETSKFNSGFNDFYKYSITNHIPLVIYLHAEVSELRKKEYDEQGNEIIMFCKKNNIRLIKELDFNFPQSSYIDNIHFNSQGQEKLFEVLKSQLTI